MTKCIYCNKEMLNPNVQSCDKDILVIAEKNGFILERYYRDTTYYDANERCHDCGILNKSGNIHHFGCDIERCPKCGLQLISCDCFEGKSLSLTTTKESLAHLVKRPVEPIEPFGTAK